MEAAEEVAGALDNEIVEQQSADLAAEQNDSEKAEQETSQTVASSESKIERPQQEALNIAGFRSPQHVADIGRECTALHHVFGADVSKKGNMSLIEHDTVIYATSTAVVFQNVSTAAKEYLLSVGDNGIGCVAVHPSRLVFNLVYIYSIRVITGHCVMSVQKNICCWWQRFPTEHLHLLIPGQKGEDCLCTCLTFSG